jgi:hypothetical protein
MHPMDLLCDFGHVESRFNQLGDSGSVSASYVHGLRETYHRLVNHFRRARWYSYVMRLKWMLILVYLEIVLILRQDRCTVCVECTIGLKIILDAPDGTPRCRGTRGCSFWSVWT